MRGAERPDKTKWSRPFLAPLKPLSDLAAHQMFNEIADDIHEAAAITELLALTANLPLAVSLIASVASSEGCQTTLSRWHTERTRMLSDGYDQRSSLDISIMLSLYSPRVTPDAQNLLSILSILPDGLSEADLTHIDLPIPNTLACKSALLQTALAYIGTDKRLKVLVPIREHVYHSLPPSIALKAAMLQHFQRFIEIVDLTKESQAPLTQITHNIGNINSVLLEALQSKYLDVGTVAATIVAFSRFYGRTGRGLSPLTLQLAGHLENWQNHPVFGSYLRDRLHFSLDFPILNPEKEIALGHQFFEHSNDLEKGTVRFHVMCFGYLIFIQSSGIMLWHFIIQHKEMICPWHLIIATWLWTCPDLRKHPVIRVCMHCSEWQIFSNRQGTMCQETYMQRRPWHMLKV
jgi:hypothetical protein